jgi:N-acetylmuramoyl-L-alanine amidase
MLAVAYYILKVIICSGILYGYYRLALHNKLFHRWNRFYLLCAIIMSLSFPLIKINIWHTPSDDDGQVIKLLNVVTTGDEMVFEASRNGHFHLTGEQGVAILYILVSLVLFIILTQTLIRLNKLIRHHVVQKIQQIHFVDTEAKGTPFSFFRYIFWNQHIDVNSATGKKIFLHELTHVKEKHSADRLFMNIVLIFFWCNPFFWLIRREMNMIHEFIADSKAVDDNDTSAFAAMILQAAYPQQAFGLTSNFFNSSIKRRLQMLTKMQNPSVTYIGRILALPLLTIIFLAFTVKTKQHILPREVIGVTTLEKTFTVVIDAGHGGEDAGARGKNGLSEKDIALTLARKIKTFNTNSNINILLTRNEDVFMSVKEKVNFTVDQKPDAFISLHVSSKRGDIENKGTSGFEIYVSRKTNSNEAKTKLLASTVSQEIAKTYTIAPDLKQRKQQGVWVLDAPEINYPSILVECGYMDDKKDLAFITNESNQEKIAKDILSAIEKYAKAAENMIGITFQDSNNPSKVSSDTIRFAATSTKNNKGGSQNANEIVFKAVELKNASLDKDTVPVKVKSVDVTRDNNVVIIYDNNTAERITRAEAEKRGIVVSPPSPPANITFRGASADSAIFILDGVEMPAGQMNKLDGDNVESIKVLKDQDAVDKYGERARNRGVVEVTMKKDKVVTVIGRPANGNDKETAVKEVTVVGHPTNGDKKETTLKDVFVVGYPTSPDDKTFYKVEEEAKFPGGEGEWSKYISSKLYKEVDALTKANKSGTCVVQFIVDTEGNISDVKAVTMQGTKLSEIAIDAVKKGPKWVPATQNGKKVKAYRKQPVTFHISKG